MVARRAGATVYSSRGPKEPLLVAAQVDHPEGRKKSGELDSDRPGRSFDRGGQGKHALSTEETASEHDERMFANELAELLDKNRNDGVFDLLVLVAGPKLLGKLRVALSEPTRRLIKAELAKDLIDPTEAELRRHLEGLVNI